MMQNVWRIMPIKLDKKSFGSVAKGDILVPHLDKIIGQGDFNWTFDYSPKVEDTAWHPSGDCTPSVHDLWSKTQGLATERPISISLYKTFIVGHFWHQYVQHIVVYGLGYADESSIERKGKRVWDGTDDKPIPFHWATGAGDIAPCEIPGHGEYLVDIKTMNAHDFNSPRPPRWAVDKWECQVNIYMDFFDLDKAIILGVMKDSPHDFKEFEFTRNQPLIDEIYNKWKLVGGCLKADLEPPVDHDIDLPLAGPTR